jgi:two-component system sensor histidine kinase TctE
MPKWWRGPASVRVRLRILLFAVFGLGAMFALLAGWSFARSAADQAYDRLLESAAVQFLDGTLTASGRVSVLPPESAFDTLALADDDRYFYAVRGPSGVVLTGYPELPQERLSDGKLIEARDVQFMGARVRVLTMRRPVRTAHGEGFLTVSVAQTRLARDTMQKQLFEQSAPVTLAIAALGLIASLIAASFAVRPLARLEIALQSRKPQDVAPLSIDGPRETQGLVDAINALVQRIGRRVLKLEHFAGLAAHQLRTPLAALGSQIDLLANDTENEQARRKRVERLSLRLKELNRLIHQLLSQAMVAYRGDIMPLGPVDLSALARSIARDILEASRAHRKLRIDVEDQSVVISGDEVMLREAMTNIITNAITHGARERVSIRISREGANAMVRVSDDGPGIPPEKWEVASEPFAMKRQGDTGAGLGLSIARQTAISHGGDLAFGRDEKGAFTVTMQLSVGGAP